MGLSLGAALQRAGWTIVGVCDTSVERRRTVRETLGVEVHHEITALCREAAVVLVAVPDSAIEAVAEEAREKGACGPAQIWIHVSGAKPATALSPLLGRVLAVGAVHPAHVFAPGQVTQLKCGFTFAVDGGNEILALAERMASDLGGRTVRVSGDQRTAYHAATVLASNCVAALLAESRRLMAAGGIGTEDAERLVVSLARSAVSHAGKVGVNASLSGPIRRGDADTVSAHLGALGAVGSSQEIYRTLGLATVRLAKEIGQTDRRALHRIAALLKDDLVKP